MYAFITGLDGSAWPLSTSSFRFRSIAIILHAHHLVHSASLRMLSAGRPVETLATRPAGLRLQHSKAPVRTEFARTRENGIMRGKDTSCSLEMREELRM